MKNNENFKSFRLLTILFFIHYSLCIEECKQGMMQFFSLQGSKYPIYMDSEICGEMQESCCLENDNLRMYSLWHNYTFKRIKNHQSFILYQYESLFKFYQIFLDIDTKNIKVISDQERLVNLKYKVCGLRAVEEDEEDENHERNLSSVFNDNTPQERSLRQKYKKIRKLDNKKIGPNKDEKKDEKKEEKKEEKKDEKKTEEQKKAEEKSANNSLAADFLGMSPEGLSTITSAVQEAGDVVSEQVSDSIGPVDDTDYLKEMQDAVLDGVQQVRAQVMASPPEPEEEPIVEEEEPEKPPLFVPMKFHEELPYQNIVCSETNKRIVKRFTVKNKKKKKFCLDQREVIQNFDFETMEEAVNNIRIEMMRMMELKKSFFCSMCDLHKQRYIDPVNKIITFDQNFCRNLIFQFKDYIKFTNVIIIEYIDALLQYVRCFQSAPDESQWPNPNFLHPYKKRFREIGECLQNLDKKDFMDYCQVICNRFSYTTFEGFFDGDVKLLKQVNMILFSFQRKLESNQMEINKLEEDQILQWIDDIKLPKTSDEEDIDDEEDDEERKLHGMLFNYTHDEIEDLEERTKTFKNQIPPNEIIVDDDEVSFIDNRKSIPSTERFRNRFEDDFNAINPLEVEDSVNLGVDIESSIQRRCDQEKKIKREPLSADVLTDFFQIDQQLLDDFANDLFLPIVDTGYFLMQQKEIEKQEKIAERKKQSFEKHNKFNIQFYNETQQFRSYSL